MHAFNQGCNSATVKRQHEPFKPPGCVAVVRQHAHALHTHRQTASARRPFCASSGILRRQRSHVASNLGTRVLSDSCAIRNFRETDAEAVVQLQATAFYDRWGNEWADKLFFSLFQAEVRSTVQQKVKSDDESFQCIIATEQTTSQPVAVIEVSLQSSQEVLRALAAGSGETYAYVACMAVQEDYRRQGLASKLLKAAEKQAQAWKQHVVALHVYKVNDIALKTYEKAGYELLQVDSAWRAVLGAKQRILMYKNL